MRATNAAGNRAYRACRAYLEMGGGHMNLCGVLGL